MADKNEVACPDEVEDAQIEEKVTEAPAEVPSDSEEEPPAEAIIKLRNAILVPPNCPPGMVKGADGVCRDPF